MLNILRAAVILIAVVAVACGQTPKDDPRVAELQQELAAMKKDLDAGKQATTGAAEGPAATTGQVQAAPANGDERRRRETERGERPAAPRGSRR